MSLALDALPLSDQVEHLKHMIAELTAPAEDCVPFPGARLRPSAKRMLNLLHTRRPGLVPYSALYAAVTWDRIGKEPDTTIVPVQLCYAKRDLAAAGIPWPIENIHGVGYRWVA
jgi:DNA-binding response OmpR family regulator